MDQETFENAVNHILDSLDSEEASFQPISEPLPDTYLLELVQILNSTNNP